MRNTSLNPLRHKFLVRNLHKSLHEESEALLNIIKSIIVIRKYISLYSS